MLKLKKYILPHGWFMLLGLCIKFLATISELMIPAFMRTIVDEKVPEGNLQQIYLYGGAMLLCAVIALVANIVANRMSAVSSGRITRTLRHDLFCKLEHLSARQMDRITTPSAISRLTSDTYNVNMFLTRIQRMGIRAPIILVGSMIMMLSMDWTLSLVLIALLPLIGLTVYFVTKTTVPLFGQAQNIQDEIVRVCQENITGIRVIKALSKTDYERKRFNEVNQRHNATAQKAALINNISSPVTDLILNLGLTLVVVLGAYRVKGGQMDAGIILAFLQYFTMMLGATMGITRIFIIWSKGEASAQRIVQVLGEPEDLQILPQQAAEANAPHIEFRNVSFSYTGIGTNLENLSFRLEHGQTLGIIGSTGAGKSTLINLLLRLYDPDSGQILIDGQDIRTIDRQTLCQKFGMVFQNDFITEGTIAHNIRFFRDLEDSALDLAAQTAQAGFIAEKEGGMEAEVAIRGNNLSGGQKQRLLIARALAADPEILVLDDASSALDYATDAALRRALRQNYRNTTTVLVAQRVSSLRHADLILVLDDSRVIGAGNHNTLMETCDEYRMIAQTQMGDGQEVV